MVGFVVGIVMYVGFLHLFRSHVALAVFLFFFAPVLLCMMVLELQTTFVGRGQRSAPGALQARTKAVAAQDSVGVRQLR